MWLHVVWIESVFLSGLGQEKFHLGSFWAAGISFVLWSLMSVCGLFHWVEYKSKVILSTIITKVVGNKA